MDIQKVKQLRMQTGISLGECQKALDQADNNVEKAKEILKEKGIESVRKKSERKTGAGIIDAYIHPNKRVGVLLDIRCETDFVASNQDFQALAHDILLHIAAIDSKDKEALLAEPFVRDESKTINDLIVTKIAKLGENIAVEEFVRFEI